MSLFDSWAIVNADLVPGTTYRATYTVTCINSASSNQVAENLSLFGINLVPTASLVTGFWGATDTFTVNTRIGQDGFRAALSASFAAASAGSWVACSDVTVSSIEELVVDGNNPLKRGTGFTLGIGVAAVIALAAVYISWRAK